MHSFADDCYQLHESPQKRTLTRDLRLETDRDRANIRPCDDLICKKRIVICAPPTDSVCDLESIRPPGSPTASVTGCPAVSGLGDIASGKCTLSIDGTGPIISITRHSPMFEEHCAENTSHLSHDESGADADEVTSSFCRPRDSKTDLARSSSECSMVTSTHGIVIDKRRCRERNPYFLRDEQLFQPFESSSIGWTDDKHSSYLSSMEDDFVRNMYERVFCAVDVCGQSPECADPSEIDSAQSQLRSLHDGATCGLGEFRVWRNGGWRPVVLKKQFVGGNSSPAVLSNPWIKRFRPSNNGRSHSGSNVSQSKKGVLPACLGDLKILHYTNRLVGKQTPDVVSDVEKGVHLWHERLQSQCYTVDKHSSGIMPRAMKAFRRDDRMHAEGAFKRLKLQQKRECEKYDILEGLQKQKLTAGVSKRLKAEYQLEIQGAYTFSRDHARKSEDVLPLSLREVCENVKQGKLNGERSSPE